MTISNLIDRGQILSSIYPGSHEGKSHRRVLRSDFWNFVRSSKFRLPPGMLLPPQEWLVVSSDHSLTKGLMVYCLDGPLGPPREATNSFAAGLALAGSPCYQYILLDADTLGSLETHRAIERIRENFTEQAFGVVISNDELNGHFYERAGAMHLWRKPITHDDVARTLNELFRNDNS